MKEFKIEREMVRRDGSDVCMVRVKGDLEEQGAFAGPKADALFQVLSGLLEAGCVEWEMDLTQVRFLNSSAKYVLPWVADFSLEIADFYRRDVLGRRAIVTRRMGPVIRKTLGKGEPLDARASAGIKAFFATCRQRQEQESGKSFIGICRDELDGCAFEHEMICQDGVEVCILRIKGDIEGGVLWNLEAELDKLFAAGHFNLEIDLEKVSYIHSGGDGLLMSAGRRARHMGGNVVFFNVSDKIMNIMCLLGFMRLFPFYGVGEYSQDYRYEDEEKRRQRVQVRSQRASLSQCLACGRPISPEDDSNNGRRKFRHEGCVSYVETPIIPEVLSEEQIQIDHDQGKR